MDVLFLNARSILITPVALKMACCINSLETSGNDLNYLQILVVQSCNQLTPFKVHLVQCFEFELCNMNQKSYQTFRLFMQYHTLVNILVSYMKCTLTLRFLSPLYVGTISGKSNLSFKILPFCGSLLDIFVLW